MVCKFLNEVNKVLTTAELRMLVNVNILEQAGLFEEPARAIDKIAKMAAQ